MTYAFSRERELPPVPAFEVIEYDEYGVVIDINHDTRVTRVGLGRDETVNLLNTLALREQEYQGVDRLLHSDLTYVEELALLADALQVPDVATQDEVEQALADLADECDRDGDPIGTAQAFADEVGDLPFDGDVGDLVNALLGGGELPDGVTVLFV
jgi:hypothetical protein